MIARLSGIVMEKGPGHVVIDVGGVGYLVAISFQTYQELPGAGLNATLFIHTHVRQDTLALFGFVAETEKKLFELLIAVSGVGPRLALTLLSGVPAEDLLQALSAGDTRRLTLVPGIGKKTADRLALELQDKARKLAAPSAGGLPAEDVVSALVNFGYKKGDAERVVDSIARRGAPADFGQFLKAALAALSSSG